MSTVVPLLEKKLGAPAGVVVLAEIGSALLFSPLLQGLGKPPNQPNDYLKFWTGNDVSLQNTPAQESQMFNNSC